MEESYDRLSGSRCRRKLKHVGTARERLCDHLKEFGVTVEPCSITLNMDHSFEGMQRCRWEAMGVVEDQLSGRARRFRVYSMDTVTDCANKGIDFHGGRHSDAEVSAR